LKSEPDELEKAKISESIRKLRIWGEENDWSKVHNWR
jgi:hypothetical protein